MIVFLTIEHLFLSWCRAEEEEKALLETSEEIRRTNTEIVKVKK